MKSLRKFLVLVSLMGWGNAYAALLQIELTGNLDYGYQYYADTFGVGSTGEVLTGREATFRYTIDTDASRNSYLDSNYRQETAGSAYGFPAGFITSSVTINNVTRTENGDDSSYLYMKEDTDGSGFNDYDGLYIESIENNNNHASSVYDYTYINLYAVDYVSSILDGFDLDQLDGWSDLLISFGYGYASFGIYDYHYDYGTYSWVYDEYTHGKIYLNNVRIWGEGLNSGTTPVSEPGSMALLAGGLGLLAARRRMRR